MISAFDAGSASIRRTCCSRTSGSSAFPARPASSSSSSGMLLHRKNDSREASSRSLTGRLPGAAPRIALDAEQEVGLTSNPSAPSRFPPRSCRSFCPAAIEGQAAFRHPDRSTGRRYARRASALEYRRRARLPQSLRPARAGTTNICCRLGVSPDRRPMRDGPLNLHGFRRSSRRRWSSTHVEGRAACGSEHLAFRQQPLCRDASRTRRLRIALLAFTGYSNLESSVGGTFVLQSSDVSPPTGRMHLGISLIQMQSPPTANRATRTPAIQDVKAARISKAGNIGKVTDGCAADRFRMRYRRLCGK